MQATATESLPEHLSGSPRIRMHDPLAGFLGSAEGGVLDYGFDDAVRLAGHACPTVVAAWLMTRAALAALYPGVLPERGAVAVALRDPAEAGVAGVIARVACLVTGAAGEEGFKGIAGRFVRRGLLQFGADIEGELRFTRLDNGHAVDVAARLDLVPADPQLRQHLGQALGDPGDAQAQADFGAAWQDRVRRLLDRADDPELIVVRTTTPAR